MRALVLTHARHEDLAGFRAPLADAGYAIEARHAPDGLPDDLHGADLLVLMGGPMGVYERAAHTWLDREVALLRARLDGDRPTLGICLGAQLIAAALGASVHPGPVREVGFGPVRLLPAGAASPLRALAGVPVLHWHGDTFELPDGVKRLAETERTPNQAFRRGARLLALQFHPEVGEGDGFEPWLDGADAYVAGAGTSVASLRSDHARYRPAALAAGRQLMTEWLAGL